MADLTKIYRWDNSESATKLTGLGSTAGYVYFRDEDMGIPENIKRVYSIRFTFRALSAVAKNAAIYYMTNGGTAAINTYVPSGNLDSTITQWNNDEMTFSTIISCSSIRFGVITGFSAGVSEINNFGIEMRPVYKRVT